MLWESLVDVQQLLELLLKLTDFLLFLQNLLFSLLMQMVLLQLLLRCLYAGWSQGAGSGVKPPINFLMNSDINRPT